MKIATYPYATSRTLDLANGSSYGHLVAFIGIVVLVRVGEMDMTAGLLHHFLRILSATSDDV
jgi:hypothetical protein